jgi:hypothetical protein
MVSTTTCPKYSSLSVWNVVLTLTSDERWDLPIDGPVLATKDTGFILVPVGAVRPAAVCSGHCIALHRGAHRGGLQAWRERRPGLQVPEVLIEASAKIVVKAESAWVIAIHCPLRPGTAPPFIGQGGSCLHACCTIFLRVKAWRAMPRSWRPSCRILLQSRRHGASCARTGAASTVAA